jgi:hypothetical protein
MEQIAYGASSHLSNCLSGPPELTASLPHANLRLGAILLPARLARL